MPPYSLVLPGILDLPSTQLGAVLERSPLLVSLLAASVSTEELGGDAWAWLCGALRIPRQSDWPLAPVWAAADELDVGSDYWLLATPVALEVGRVDVRLMSASASVDDAEATVLLEALNAHFADDDLHFVRGRSGRWFARQRAAAHIATHAPEATRGHSLRDFLPHGPDAGRWRRWQNEIQMLMHAEHERSAGQDSPGEANAIWFWGGGTLPARNTAPDVSIASDDADVIALATHAGATSSALRDFACGSGKTNIAVLWNAAAPVSDRDAADGLTSVDARSAPDVDLVLTGSARSRVVHSRRGSLWQRWRRRLQRADIAALMARAQITGAEDN